MAHSLSRKGPRREWANDREEEELVGACGEEELEVIQSLLEGGVEVVEEYIKEIGEELLGEEVHKELMLELEELLLSVVE